MSTNKWIADRGYGSGMALAFEGDPAFIERSINFAVNFLLSEKSEIRKQMPSFVIVNTTFDNLRNALETEGYCMKMAELLNGQENPLDIMREEDYPADWEDRLRNFERDLIAAKTPAEVADVMKRDPMRGLVISPTAENEAEARAFGKEYAQTELAKVTFEDFMRKISRAPLETHAMVEMP